MNFVHTNLETLYIAYFGRPADKPGLVYWEQEAETHASIPRLATNFAEAAMAQSAEYQALVPDQSPEQRITAFYQNLFGHAPDAAGLAYWTGALARGDVQGANLGSAIAYGASGADAATLHAKVTAALTFTNSLPADIIWYSGDNINAKLRTALAKVTADHPDLPTADLGLPPHAGHEADLQQLYVTYLDRPADPGGLAFWSKALDAGAYTLSGVAAEFAHSAEHVKNIAGLDAAHLVSAAYQDLFHRAPDADGFSYWVHAVESGQLAQDHVAGAMAEGARGDDALLLHNKVLAAIDYTGGLVTPAEVESATTGPALAYAKSYLDMVTVSEPYPSSNQAVGLVGVHPHPALQPG